MSSLSPVNANEPATLPAQTEQQRIDKALALAVAYGGIDGDHHKAWVIDQMVRALTGCPVVQNEHTDSAGRPYAYLGQGESPAYTALVAEACAGEDGPHTYSWEKGIAP